MRLLNPTLALLLPTLAATTVLAFTVPASIPASPTPVIQPSDNVQLVAYWSPISTITRIAAPTTNADLEADPDHDLLRREVVTGAAAAQPTDGTQISPITTYQVYQLVNGVEQQVELAYTQLFSAVPDQGLAPASGSIGLGTIQGQIGVVKTGRKRDAKPQPTEIADIKVEKRNLAGKVDANSAGSALALLVAITAMIVV